LFIGGFSALVNLALFILLLHSGVELAVSTLSAFFGAAVVNYYLSILFIFRHKARWKTGGEVAAFFLVVSTVGLFDLYCTRFFISLAAPPWMAKLISTAVGLVLNFAGRRFIVFPEKARGDWKPQGRR
jgi:putative flippase GtrA